MFSKYTYIFGAYEYLINTSIWKVYTVCEYTNTVQKFGVGKIFLVSYAHQSCSYLIRNTVKTG